VFKSANNECGPRLDRFLLPSHGGSFQQQLKLLTDKSNGALTIQRDRTLRTLLTWSGVALAIMALISIVLGWVMGGRALGPMRRMSARARQITEENLHERLSTDTQDGEVGELATTFDGVLARLERAFAAQKRFVANASHELRTPVTVERTLLEVALADPDTDAETLRRTCERVLVSTKEQQTTIEALLALARSQGGTDVEAPVDLADLAQDAVTLREQRFDHLMLATDLHSAPLTGDPALLERLVSNLIENAIVHNVADGWISIETGHERSGSWLRVSNSGAEVPEAMVSEIFEPFRRIDGERTATATGLGLGLSIVQAIADVHGATVQASPVEGGGLRVEVRF
jgi:signal transduction histidine kinase